MGKNPCKGGTQQASRNGPSGKKQRRPDVDEESGGDKVKCSGKSCAAGIIADCVALCCCPCAVVNILTLAFVKVPYMMGRKCCLGKKKKKKKRKSSCERKKNEEEMDLDLDLDLERERGGIFSLGVEKGRSENGDEIEITNNNNSSARIDVDHEAEKVWSELNQVGHLGFGGVS